MQNNRYTDDNSSWFSKKGIISIVLFGTALLFALYQYGRLHPKLTSAPPRAEQWEKEKYDKARKELKAGMESLGLSKEQKEKLDNWKKWNGKGKSQEERKAHNAELKKILDPLQLKEYKSILNEQKAKMDEIRQAHQDRIIRMIGKEDFDKMKNDNKIIKERREQKIPKTKSNDTNTTQTANKRKRG